MLNELSNVKLVKVTVLLLAFGASSLFSLYAQDRNRKSPINRPVTGAYLKKYLNDHPQANVVFAYSDANLQPVYRGLYSDLDKLVSPPNINSENFANLKLTIKELLMDHITEEYTLLNVESLKGRSYCLSLLEKNNSDLLVYISFRRGYVEVAPKDKSFKILSLNHIKGYKHDLSVNSIIYFRDRLENDDIAFKHTGFDIGLGEEPEEIDTESGAGVSELIGAGVTSISSLLGFAIREYSVVDTTHSFNDAERWNNANLALANRAQKDIRGKLSVLTQKLSSDSDIEDYILGVVSDASLYHQEETIVANFAEPKFKKKKGLMNKLEGLGEAVGTVTGAGSVMVVLIKGDDKFTPWVTETEHMRIIGRLGVLLSKKGINDYEGEIKIKKLTEGIDIKNINKAIIINNEELGWVLYDVELLANASESDIIDFFGGEKKAVDIIEDKKSKYANESTLDMERKKNELLGTSFGVTLPSLVYVNEKDPLLFPNTMVEERNPLAQAPKKEKRSLIARINRMKNSNAKIGVVYALQESYEEKQSTTHEVNGEPSIEKENYKLLDESFYPLGKRLANQLNENFSTDVFEQIDMYDFPMKEASIIGLKIQAPELVGEKFNFPAFENTQYPVVVFYTVEAVENLEGKKSLSSHLVVVEFYENDQKTHMKSVGFSHTYILGNVEMAFDQDYVSYIEKLKTGEDVAIDDYVDLVNKYHDKKVK